ncbi:unnamed protein product, partial [Polarella glacialis]
MASAEDESRAFVAFVCQVIEEADGDGTTAPASEAPPPPPTTTASEEPASATATTPATTAASEEPCAATANCVTCRICLQGGGPEKLC